MIARRKELVALLLSVAALLGSLGRADAQTMKIKLMKENNSVCYDPIYPTVYDKAGTLIYSTPNPTTTGQVTIPILTIKIEDKRVTLKFSKTFGGNSLLDVENILGTFTGEQKFDVVIPATYAEIVDDLPACVISDTTFDCRHRIRIFRLRCR